MAQDLDGARDLDQVDGIDDADAAAGDAAVDGLRVEQVRVHPCLGVDEPGAQMASPRDARSVASPVSVQAAASAGTCTLKRISARRCSTKLSGLVIPSRWMYGPPRVRRDRATSSRPRKRSRAARPRCAASDAAVTVRGASSRKRSAALSTRGRSSARTSTLAGATGGAAVTATAATDATTQSRAGARVTRTAIRHRRGRVPASCREPPVDLDSPSVKSTRAGTRGPGPASMPMHVVAIRPRRPADAARQPAAHGALHARHHHGGGLARRRPRDWRRRRSPGPPAPRAGRHAGRRSDAEDRRPRRRPAGAAAGRCHARRRRLDRPGDRGRRRRMASAWPAAAPCAGNGPRGLRCGRRRCSGSWAREPATRQRWSPGAISGRTN